MTHDPTKGSLVDWDLGEGWTVSIFDDSECPVSIDYVSEDGQHFTASFGLFDSQGIALDNSTDEEQEASENVLNAWARIIDEVCEIEEQVINGTYQ